MAGSLILLLREGMRFKHYTLVTKFYRCKYWLVECNSCKEKFKRSSRFIQEHPDGNCCPKCINGMDKGNQRLDHHSRDRRKFRYGRTVNGFVDKSIKIYKGDIDYDRI